MIKKGYDLFLTSNNVIEEALHTGANSPCCEVCTFPLPFLCKPFCKCRKATVAEWIDAKIGEGWRK